MDMSVKTKRKMNPIIEAIFLGATTITIFSIIMIGISIVNKTMNEGVLAVTVIANIFIWAMSLHMQNQENHKELMALLKEKLQ